MPTKSLAWVAVLCCSAVLTHASPGLDNLQRKAYLPPIMDSEIFANLWQAWEPVAREQARQASAPQRRQLTLARYGLREAPYDNGGAPLGLVSTAEGYSMSCFMCHAGAVEGKTVLGLPNVALDLASLYEDVVKTVILLHGDRPGNPPFPLGLVSGSPDPAPANVVFPEGLFSITRGATNAFGFSVHWLMWRNEDMELVQTPYDLRPMEHYLDTPPWWHTMKKALFYYDGFTTKTHKAMMQVSLDPSIGPAQLMGFEDDYAEIYEWLHTLSPPAYQGPVNARRATAGADVYASNCAQCHGQPGPGGEYHDRMSPIDEVQTDRGRLDGLSPQFRAHYKRSWLGDYSNAAITVRPVGYVAPPLDGIWASAPYLHNGSVPTLYHLLFADERPPVWRVRDYDRYDHDQLGLVVDSFEAMPSTASRFEKRRFYDTSQPTLGNEGHRFADELSREERYQLLEYLKTL